MKFCDAGCGIFSFVLNLDSVIDSVKNMSLTMVVSA